MRVNRKRCQRRGGSKDSRKTWGGGGGGGSLLHFWEAGVREGKQLRQKRVGGNTGKRRNMKGKEGYHQITKEWLGEKIGGAKRKQRGGKYD